MPKGFTLLELLIVIAILAVLSTAVVLILNPAEAIKRARDTQRISDLDGLKTAIILWLTEGNTDIGATTCVKAGAGFDPCQSDQCKGDTCAGGNKSSDINGNGWIPIDFTSMSGGSPLSHLPVDPVNKDNSLYYYAADGTNFELNARMESKYYQDKNKVRENDGGDSGRLYEVGTKLTIFECVIDADCADESTNTKCSTTGDTKGTCVAPS